VGTIQDIPTPRNRVRFPRCSSYFKLWPTATCSKTGLNSHVDRHEHIGHGYIGMEGFRRILNHPKLRQKAFILETPIDEEGDDVRNIETLKKLCRKSRTTISRSN
jgi:hypothetical protein